ncbi:helix-turn-helix transcriptional regulator [Leifsonia poae]|uniref:helix-turn-helix transcriptional regulator n=1 Tax=Leifsonia poae TaxID=110933 RepID=UPI003D681F11
MASTGSRALQLLSLLQNHRYWPGHELADRLGISPRTLRRDVERLRDLGYPVDATRGVSGGYQLAAGASLPRWSSTTTRPSRSRSACAQRPRAGSPASTRPPSARSRRWCRSCPRGCGGASTPSG